MGNKATKQGDSTIVSSTSSISNNNANSQAQSNNENQLSSASNNKPFPPSPSSIAASNIFSSSSYTKGGVRGSKDVIQLRKKTQEKYISRAKEYFYTGNQLFRDAKFDDAKINYRKAVETLKEWSNTPLFHNISSQAISSATEGDSNNTADQVIVKEHVFFPSNSSNSNAAAYKISEAEAAKKRSSGDYSATTVTAAPSVNPSAELATPTDATQQQSTSALTFSVSEFAEDCYHESRELLDRAISLHNKDMLGRVRSSSSVSSSQTAEESLISFSLLMKRELSLLKSWESKESERLLISQLNEYSTLDAMIADLLNNLAACHEVMGELHDAMKLFNESLQLRIIVYGKESLKVAETMQNLATILDSLKDHASAEHLLTDALEIERRELGDDHIEIAVTMNNLGVLLAHSGQFDRAKELLSKSVAMREDFYGLEHHLTTCAKQNLDYVNEKLSQSQTGSTANIDPASTNSNSSSSSSSSAFNPNLMVTSQNASSQNITSNNMVSSTDSDAPGEDAEQYPFAK